MQYASIFFRINRIDLLNQTAGVGNRNQRFLEQNVKTKKYQTSQCDPTAHL
jgi:hypothetical protein